MKIRRPIRAERGHVPEELDGLQFAAELEFQGVAQGELVSRGQSQRLESGIVQVGIGRSEAAGGHGDRWIGAVGQVPRITRAHNRRREALAIPYVTAEVETPVGKDGALEAE